MDLIHWYQSSFLQLFEIKSPKKYLDWIHNTLLDQRLFDAIILIDNPAVLSVL